MRPSPYDGGMTVVAHLQVQTDMNGWVPVAPGVSVHPELLKAMGDVRIHDGEPPVEDSPVRALRRRVTEAEEMLEVRTRRYQEKTRELVEERRRKYKERGEAGARLLEETRRTTLLRLVVETLTALRADALDKVAYGVSDQDNDSWTLCHPLARYVEQVAAAVDDPCLSAYYERLFPDGDSDEYERGALLHCVRSHGHLEDHLDQRGEEFTETDRYNSPAEW